MTTHLRLRIAIMFSVSIKVVVIIMTIPFTMVSICIIFTNGSRGWNKKRQIASNDMDLGASDSMWCTPKAT